MPSLREGDGEHGNSVLVGLTCAYLDFDYHGSTSFMIPHTKSFKTLKDEAQRVFDFVIVVAYAVPALKRTLDTLEPGKALPFKPDHFDSTRIPTEKVRFHCREYKALLSRYIFLSSFSFFEAYFVDVLREIIEFHTKESLLQRLEIAANLTLTDPDSLKAKRKLREYATNANRDGYYSYGRQLASKGYHFPSALLSRFGLQRLFEQIESSRIRAEEIPTLAREVLQLNLTQAECEHFHRLRQIRNKIAHGRASSALLHLKKAVDANNFLRNLALKIDRHVCEHYLLVERY